MKTAPMETSAGTDAWPSLPFERWRDTCETLHLWFQIVGKIRLKQCAWTNHSWHVALHVTATGLTTSTMAHGDRMFQIDFDFIRHQLLISVSDGQQAALALQPQSVASFYRSLMEQMQQLGLGMAIHAQPNEVTHPIPFAQDEVHCAYDAEYANRFWRVLLQADRVFRQFRARFVGKCSPVHFFWGAPDLAVTRFSGRAAPQHPGGVPNLPDWVTREAYSHEVSSCGFWPGGEGMSEPVFYSYAYPQPPGFASAAIRPAGAFYNQAFKEFILPYDVVRLSTSPDQSLLEFLQSSYEAAAQCGHWDRAALECADGFPKQLRS